MNYNNFEQETSRMLHLMNYGINENTSKSSAPRVEYSVKAADGITYGIVNEGNKYYIKSAPKKDTQILSEDFDYIGGIMNKKQNEFKSYSAASKHLDLKIMQINEANKPEKKVLVESSKPAVASDWQITETKEMRAAINRMNQISRNVGYILTEGSIPSEHTLPEAPASNPSNKQVNAPFTDTATAKGDKDFKQTETNHEKPGGSPYNQNANATLTSDKKPTCGGDNGNAYSDNCKYVPDNSVAHSKASGGKVTRADEGKKRVLKLTESQVLAWNNSNPDFMDKSHGTQIGSSAPYSNELDGKTSNQGEANTETIHESEGPVHNSDTTLYPNGSTGEVGHNGDPFANGKGSTAEAQNGVIAEGSFEDEGIAGFDGLDDTSDVPFPEVEDDFADGLGDDEDEYYLDLDDEDGLEDEPLFEQRLNDFGKHPAYRKTPFTLPANKEVAPNGARDWNDESAEGEEPFGKQIGSSAPFEKAVQKITNSIMESLGF